MNSLNFSTRLAYYLESVRIDVLRVPLPDNVQATRASRAGLQYIFLQTPASEWSRHYWHEALLRTVQELLGHKDVRTTIICTHIPGRGVAVQSPLDPLLKEHGVRYHSPTAGEMVSAST